MLKKIIVRLLKSMGYSIIPIDSKNLLLNYQNVNTNFINLSTSYETLFSEKFGQLSFNKNRINILKELLGTSPSEAYFIINSLDMTNIIEGDVCEFGVAQGITSQLIANEILNKNSKSLHLFDSFEGLPKPTEKDTLKDDIFNLGNIEAYEGKMSVPEKSVINRLKTIKFPKNRVIIHKGFIEEIIINKKQFPEYVSFAYVDFDFYEPIKITLDYLIQVTKKGAIIVVDDYDFFSTGAKTAVDEFIKEQNATFNLFIPDRIHGCFAILTRVSD
jgi:hypothetical protein